MTVEELKEKMRAGEAEFTYRKKDGTERKARGTLCEALMPKSVPCKKFKIHGIKWDTADVEGEIPKLPKHCVLSVPTAELDGLTPDEVNEYIVNELSEQYGFLLEELVVEAVENKPAKKLPDGTIFYYDLDKAGFRSFHESQLVG